MKKRKRILLLIIPFALIISVILFVFIQNRTLSKNIPDITDIIYVPNGTADKYNDLYSGFTDGHVIWEYRLNPKEKDKIKSELNNGIWTKITKETMPEIIYYFTFDSESYLPNNISGNTYYCIYDFGLKRFIAVDKELSLLGWHRAIFIFDKDNSQYYCADISI